MERHFRQGFDVREGGVVICYAQAFLKLNKLDRKRSFLRNTVVFVKYRILGLRCKCEAKWSSSSDYSLSEVTRALQEIEMNCEVILCIKGVCDFFLKMWNSAGVMYFCQPFH